MRVLKFNKNKKINTSLIKKQKNKQANEQDQNENNKKRKGKLKKLTYGETRI